ncbi:putative transcriptional regulatory protein [Colletotrichum aenigma]|uniref:putative transcriptional regulatory protein n=1 Tax=Colletotrichum aenigma TaxID=1215731 RepID=UPI00187337BB|nr:putative transcriptional regulatory protein [Colletotrichum aenigma]KAF5518680.1 putative transcriptional regulatory protein [Colletotrichum aenigma]
MPAPSPLKRPDPPSAPRDSRETATPHSGQKRPRRATHTRVDGALRSDHIDIVRRIDRTLWDKALVTFQRHFATELSFLHVPTLKNRIYDLTTGHASVAFDTQLVLLGLLALTGRYHGELADYFDHGSEEVSYDPSLGDQGISEAFARTLDKSLGSFVSACSIGSVERVQALLMLGLYEWISPNHEGLRAWMLVGSAGRMAQALKLGYEANYSTANHSDATLEDAIVDREIRRRTMFSCFIFDRLISCGKERPSFIRSDDLHVRLPCAKEDFDLSRQTSTEWFSGDMDSSLHDETSILGRFVQLVDLWGRISQYSSAGGRFLDKQRPPWNPESLFFQLRREADAFSKTLEAPGAFLSLSPSNYFRHESTSSTFIILHLLMSLCKIMLHRQYLPFIPIKCTRPSGPLDEPTFPPEEVPPGFWEESARELFGASKTVANVIELCEDRLPHSPLVAFVIYTASFTGVYAQHFPRMDTEAYLCSRSSEQDEMAENQPISSSFGPTKVMFDTLSELARYSGVAAAFVARFYEVDQYFSSMVQDYHRNLRHRTTSQQSASSHLHYSAISIAIMQFFQIASILALMASSVSAAVTVGSACEGAGYECVSGNAAIASCDGAKWQLAANCGGCSDACVKPDVGTPYCKC